ncbi:uncharacterized protein L969DRAFT_67375 [Mixia osmundae IAM 14324]|uniref:Ribosome production factor 2 homolog n=1 Tax=Mixia osmundae (strain CBS 9802 / IAM 14324 / JCM 22182 / KY 12970) TaxID=764103 RepID=G7E1V8_MIXOS|nr:uncharacterized protein L969DRAFT_67375 [Mixia osmundae IAM 14324]KEI36764.1 hypothetical protein L969DRAFT_67375 [Mixia osmundae IAM 14324]GAA96818.1 hypothetical protein E5Q_03490 [Mixia osmundae IAM 14324]
MLAVNPPKTAKGKRIIKARESKAAEGAKKCIFVRGTSTSQLVNTALRDLGQLKKPDGLQFSKRNDVHPFEDAKSLEFWSQKNDASLFCVGLHSKKRPHNLVLARLFEHQILDMLEVGIEHARPITDFPGAKVAPGLKPMFHFAGELFETHPLYIQFRSLLIDLYQGEVVPAINMTGLDYVISISAGLPGDAQVGSDAPIQSIVDDDLPTSGTAPSILPLIHFRVYNVRLLKSGQRLPRVELSEMGPSFDFRLRRHRAPVEELWKQAMKRAKKPAATKAKKNVDTDEMGDKVGRIHVGRQDLSKLQSRKMKALKRTTADDTGEGSDGAASGGEGEDGVSMPVASVKSAKRRKQDEA